MAYVRELRTLPLKVAPLPGEAIDSWLEATAVKHRATFGAVLDQCGIRAGGIYGARLKSRLMTPPQQTIDDIAYVAGLTPDVVRGMTLTPLEPAPPPRHNHWEWRVSSRACPHCLAETDGRWMLSWRHNLTFACMKHRCLLIDACAVCRQPLRSRPHRVRLVPVPGRCAASRRNPGPGVNVLCGADLTIVSSPPLEPDHAVLWAQRHIVELRSGCPPTLAFDGDPARSPDVLRDVLVLARWMVSSVDHAALDSILSTLDVCAHFDLPSWPATMRNAISPQSFGNPSVASTAVSIALGLAILDSASGQEARNLLQRILTAAGRSGWIDRSGARDLRRRLSAPVSRVYEFAFDKVRSSGRTTTVGSSASQPTAAPSLPG